MARPSPYLPAMEQYGDVTSRAGMGFFRRAAPVAAACQEAAACKRGLSTLDYDSAVQDLWCFARAHVDATVLEPAWGRLYDATRSLSSYSASMLEAGVSLCHPSTHVEQFLAAYGEVEGLLRGCEVRLLIDLLVEDEALLRAYAHSRLQSFGEVDCDLLKTPADCALAAAITANENPPLESYGLKLESASARPLPKEPRGGLEAAQLSAVLTVTDPALLVSFAVAQFRRTSFDSYWEPRDLAEAALEALYLSNDNPSSADWGVATEETCAVVNRVT